jgi:hypothetical protein
MLEKAELKQTHHVGLHDHEYEYEPPTFLDLIFAEDLTQCIPLWRRNQVVKGVY